MNIKKIWFMVLAYATQSFADHHVAKVKSSVCQGWCAKLMSYWESLGTHTQLAIQLVLVLVVFYLLSRWIQCKKNGSCGAECKSESSKKSQ